MEEIFLDIELREEIGRSKVKDLRERGFIAGVVYKDGKESFAIKASHRELIRLFHQHHLENAVINLRIKDDKKHKPRPCLVKEVQYHPVYGEIIHVDFNEISLTKEIKINIPVVAKGEPAGVKQEGGSLEHILWEVEVECLPTQIPKAIEVDVSALKIGDAIHIKDIIFPPGTKVLDNPDAVVLSVASPIKEEVPLEAVEGEEKKEPEVIKEKKETPGEAEAEDKDKKDKEKK